MHEARHRIFSCHVGSIAADNREQIEAFSEPLRAIRNLDWTGGLSFKPDRRSSGKPAVTGRAVLGEGTGYGPRPECGNLPLVGGNRAYVERHLPHLSRLMVSSRTSQGVRLVVIGHPFKRRAIGWVLAEGKRVIDLIGRQSRPGIRATAAYTGELMRILYLHHTSLPLWVGHSLLEFDTVLVKRGNEGVR